MEVNVQSVENGVQYIKAIEQETIITLDGFLHVRV